MIDIKNYFKTSSSNIEKLHIFEEKIIKISKEILNVTKAKKKLLVAGNGGSCSDAEHFVGELQCTYKDRSRDPVSAISLASLPAALTAWCNDFGFLTFFKRQVQAHGNDGDILFLISTGGGEEKSGASMSLVEAAKEAKKKNLKVISLIGKTGGLLKDISDISIIVDSNITSFIQEAHIAILHCICENLDNELNK
jgi:D-sedoheptulose 7-phosphate isomerase